MQSINMNEWGQRRAPGPEEPTTNHLTMIMSWHRSSCTCTCLPVRNDPSAALATTGSMRVSLPPKAPPDRRVVMFTLWAGRAVT